jgi:hypothetical protein
MGSFAFAPLLVVLEKLWVYVMGLIRVRAIAMRQAPPLKRCEGDDDPTWKLEGDTWLP